MQKRSSGADRKKADFVFGIPLFRYWKDPTELRQIAEQKYKTWEDYAHELEVTSRALRVLDDNAFRNIALGQNYFELMDLPYEAPALCQEGQ